MAAEAASKEPESGSTAHNGRPPDATPEKEASQAEPDAKDLDDGDDEDEDEEDEDEDTEPVLKYTRLTSSLGAVYRNGELTSSQLVAGDKMIIGTHNGNTHVYSLPHLQSLRVYRAHTASITDISISPVPQLTLNAQGQMQAGTSNLAPNPNVSPSRKPTSTTETTRSSPTPRKHATLPSTPSNSIYIATASLDGNVCVSSLIDPKQSAIRNFARPVQAVALSPDYARDRTYLSGGLAGNLILTVGGQIGVRTDANTNTAAAVASGWLGSLGLVKDNGKDTILHSGEGAISNIKFSNSGKYVCWVNESGIKVMRSHLHLSAEEKEAGYAWKRFAHIDRPNRKSWEEMSAVWKAKAIWIDEEGLEDEREEEKQKRKDDTIVPPKKRSEKLVVGWGDATWILNVQGGTGKGKNAAGSADILHFLRFDDCICSGSTLYTPSLLLVLAYRTRDDNDRPLAAVQQDSPKRGRSHRQTGLQPELRLIDIHTKEEVDVYTLTFNRFESLSAADYSLSNLYVPDASKLPPAQRRNLTLDALGGMWEATVNTTRLFSSASSTFSGNNGRPPSSNSSGILDSPVSKGPQLQPQVAQPGLKIFIQSPYDCVLAVKRSLSDRLEWLMDRDQYAEAYELLDKHPEAVPNNAETTVSTPSTPAKTQQTLFDFFADDSASQVTASGKKSQHYSALAKEKRYIGDQWLQQLTSKNEWAKAGEVAGRVLDLPSGWEKWVPKFAEKQRINDIASVLPATSVKPQIAGWIYELVLGYYVVQDKKRFVELLEQWSNDLYDPAIVSQAIEERIVRDKLDSNSEDWRNLTKALAKLYLQDRKPRDAFRCYAHLHDADAALELIKDYSLLDAVADDIPSIVRLRLSDNEVKTAPIEKLESASEDTIHLLVDGAYQGTIPSTYPIDQLEQAGSEYRPFLFFYLRALWRGEGTESITNRRKRERVAEEGRGLVEQDAELALQLFAEYDQVVFGEFVRKSTSYDFATATRLCEERNYTSELVYLLAKTGQTGRALRLLIEQLGDIPAAVKFAKEQDDVELWDDLLKYTMARPKLIAELLSVISTALDPVRVVKQIPTGIEIPNLRTGILAFVKEFEIQDSISEGVARVLRSEVAERMHTLRIGRRKGVKFDIQAPPPPAPVKITIESTDGSGPAAAHVDDDTHASKAGRCERCDERFEEDEKDTLIGFVCGHIFHLSCFLEYSDDRDAVEAAAMLPSRFGDDEGYASRSVGAKVAHAHIIKQFIKGGCPICAESKNEEIVF